ncbi:hypothetical protein AMATHDRAFT_3400 [Amanita thiersii Skay4041]|uniref:Uncharacterized protein n=1 Tax=Amanita thiersii Skay4041 TaxID=703135 RepID=A0A2A9NRW0_9AGAR|nr:hypothetical protein AMATHDRAFT_3400 [Amanita thiersii Skay4041]
MAVMRRVPAAPAPSTHGTSSSQNSPRTPNKKPQISQRAQLAVQPKDNNVSENAKYLLRKDFDRANNSATTGCSGLSSSFSFFILTLLFIYALSTIYPISMQPFRSVLSASHDNLVKPYILPPLRAAFTHPALEPHLSVVRTTLRPFAARIENTARPAFAKLSQLEENNVRPLVRRAAAAVHCIVRHEWQRVVVSNFNTYIRPSIQPYLDRWDTFYNRSFQPRLSTLTSLGQACYFRVKPHIINAWLATAHYSSISYSAVAPRVHRLYVGSKPHVHAVWIKIRPHFYTGWKLLRIQVLNTASIVKSYSVRAASRLGEARREYVDPHIIRIWEKVGNHSFDPTPSSTTLSVLSVGTVYTTAALSSAGAGPATVIEASISTSFPVEEVLTAVSVEQTSEPHIVTIKSAIADPPLQTVYSVISESVGMSSAIEMHVNEFVQIETDILTVPSLNPTQTPAPNSNIVEEVLSTSSVQEPTATDGPNMQSRTTDEAIDDFLEELGISSSEPALEELGPIVEKQESPSPHIFSTKQEDDATVARRAKTAAKRADIARRHADWQSQIDQLSVDRERNLHDSLVSIRKRAVSELQELIHIGRQEGNQGESIVESVEAECGRLTKGLDGYIKKERERKVKLGIDWYEKLEEKKAQWEKVLARVDEKFAEKVRSVQEDVHKWTGNKNSNLPKVVKVSAELKAFAEKAQADLGLDYAWLDDVTYDDWQKYHDLMRTAERFTATARSLLNGTHVHPPVDPLIPALDALEHSVQEVITGFGVRFASLRQEGIELYVKPGETLLPVDASSSQDSLDTSDLFLSKSEEQVKQALNVAGYEMNGDKRGARGSNHDEL